MYLAPKLKYRAQIKKGINTPNDFGGFDRSYETIMTLWLNIKELSDFIEAIRGESITERWTHEFMVRKASVDRLGTEFSSAYDGSFDSIPDINSIKRDFFIFVEAGAAYRGRLFRVIGTKLDEKNYEYIKIRAELIEEQGTGWPA